MTPEEGAAWRIASFLGWKVLHSLFDDATCTSIQTFVDSVKSNPASLEKLTLPGAVGEGAAQERAPGDPQGVPGVRVGHGGRLHRAVQLQEQQ